MTMNSGEDVRQKFVTSMGTTHGPIFFQLRNECVWLHVTWQTYVTIFGMSAERWELFKKAAPTTFTAVEDSLWRFVILHICGLTDPTASGPKQTQENLTVQRLPDLVDDAQVRREVNHLLVVLEEKVKPLRLLRNKVISHQDLHVALNPEAQSQLSGGEALLRDCGHVLQQRRRFDRCNTPSAFSSRWSGGRSGAAVEGSRG